MKSVIAFQEETKLALSVGQLLTAFCPRAVFSATLTWGRSVFELLGDSCWTALGPHRVRMTQDPTALGKQLRASLADGTATLAFLFAVDHSVVFACGEHSWKSVLGVRIC